MDQFDFCFIYGCPPEVLSSARMLNDESIDAIKQFLATNYPNGIPPRLEKGRQLGGSALSVR